MIILAPLALFLAQAAAPLQTMAPAPSPSAIASAVPTPQASESIDTSVRRAPIPFSPAPDAAIIEDSGSTNYAGFKVAVSPNGAAQIQTAGGTRRGSVKRPTARWLFLHLAQDRPLAELPGAHCMKSVSFGTTTKIEWRGETTPDLSCDGDAKLRELYRTALIIEKQLGIVPERRGLRYPK